MSLTEDEEITQWEEILKDRYTSKDSAFAEHVAKPRRGPPVLEKWFPRGNNRKRPARRDDRGYGGGGYGGRDRSYGGDRERYDRAGPPEKRRAYNDYRSR